MTMDHSAQSLPGGNADITNPPTDTTTADDYNRSDQMSDSDPVNERPRVEMTSPSGSSAEVTSETNDEHDRSDPPVVSTEEIESFVLDLVVEQTGVPSEIVDVDAEFFGDLMVAPTAFESLCDEILRHFDAFPIDRSELETTTTIRMVVNLIESSRDCHQMELEAANRSEETASVDSADLWDEIMEGLGDDPVVMSYAKHLNPVLVALGRRGGWVKTFVKGEGNYLWDDAGSRYLDFVAGCGAVNLGHNPPQISEALTETLKSLAPGFAQSSLNPLTARLADRIIQLAPPGLEMAFFCNCGTEAVEAALKLARIATGRTAIVYCSGSYHGKTLGSLSVTGHEPFQAPFAPLVPDCRKVAFGDLDELGQALQAKDVAAFIVEPVQGEHGSILPPAGYLRAAQDLCRASGTLFVVDEVQTGMGRTGALFACEHDGLDPDVLTLAKSLGGGLMPVGATLTRRDVWLKGYGTADRFALHTSTFSGGSLACAAGLAALESLSEESLLASVRSRGTRLLNGLQAVADEYPTIIREVRGKGLMMGLELCPLDEAIAGIVLQGIAADERPETKEFVGDPEALLDILPATLMMQHLLDVHQIYTLMARSNPFVLRVQPPLTLTEDEADKFVEAVQDGCRKLSNPVELLSQLMMQ